MNSLVTIFNHLLGTPIDWAVRALSFLSPFATLSIISALSGVVLVFGWSKVSNQKRIRAVKKQMHARLLEAIVFRHDIRVSLKAQAGLLGLSLVYLSCALIPLVILGIPCVLFMAQLNKYYAYTPLAAGQQAIVDVTVTSPTALNTLNVVSSEKDLIVEGPVRISKDNHATYRVAGIGTGVFPLAVRVGNEAPQTVEVAVAKNARDGIEANISRNWVDALLHPTLRAKPELGSSIETLEVSYLPAKYPLLSYNLSWEVVFFAVSIIAGFVIGKLLKIEL